MSFNDGQQASHLLEWINQQRYKMGNKIPWYSFQQACEDEFVQMILMKIDKVYFNDLCQNPFDYALYLGQIQSYLDKFYGQRIKRIHKVKLIKSESMVGLTKIIFYLSIQSPQRGQFIHRVFELPTETQGKLMNQLKSIQDCVESLMQTKDLLTKIQQLEQQNDLLKDQLKQSVSQINRLQELIEQSTQQQNKLRKQCKIFKNEKNQILQQLGIVQMKQYITIYNQIKIQNELLNDTIKDIMEKNKNHQEFTQQLKQTIIDNNKVISDLNDEIVRYKQSLKNANLQLSCYEDNSRFNGQSLKQNSIIYNTNRRSSDKNSLRDTSIPLSLDSEDTQPDKLRIYNGQLMKKLELMYRKNAILNQNLETTKIQKQRVMVQRQFLQEKIDDLKHCQDIFVRNYGISISD